MSAHVEALIKAARTKLHAAAHGYHTARPENREQAADALDCAAAAYGAALLLSQAEEGWTP